MIDTNKFTKDAQEARASFLERLLKSGELIKTGEKLQLKDIKPKMCFALDNAYYEMQVSSDHFCQYVDQIHREFYTTKTYKQCEVLQWKK